MCLQKKGLFGVSGPSTEIGLACVIHHIKINTHLRVSLIFTHAHIEQSLFLASRSSSALISSKDLHRFEKTLLAGSKLRIRIT